MDNDINNLKIYYILCDKCKSKSADYINIKCPVCKNTNKARLDTLFDSSEEYIKFKKAFINAKPLLKINSRYNKTFEFKDYIWEDTTSVNAMLNIKKYNYIPYCVVKKRKQYYLFKGRFRNNHMDFINHYKLIGHILFINEFDFDIEGKFRIFID